MSVRSGNVIPTLQLANLHHQVHLRALGDLQEEQGWEQSQPRCLSWYLQHIALLWVTAQTNGGVLQEGRAALQALAYSKKKLD